MGQTRYLLLGNRNRYHMFRKLCIQIISNLKGYIHIIIDIQQNMHAYDWNVTFCGMNAWKGGGARWDCCGPFRTNASKIAFRMSVLNGNVKEELIKMSFRYHFIEIWQKIKQNKTKQITTTQNKTKQTNKQKTKGYLWQAVYRQCRLNTNQEKRMIIPDKVYRVLILTIVERQTLKIILSITVSKTENTSYN